MQNGIVVICTSVMVLLVVVIVNWMVWFHHFTDWSDGLNFLLHLSTCSNITDVMTHECNTRTMKEAVVSNEALAKVDKNIIWTVNCLNPNLGGLFRVSVFWGKITPPPV